jgi:hypothetical protein
MLANDTSLARDRLVALDLALATRVAGLCSTVRFGFSIVWYEIGRQSHSCGPTVHAYLVFSCFPLPPQDLVDVGSLGHVMAVARRGMGLLVQVAVVHGTGACIMQPKQVSREFAIAVVATRMQ